MEKIIPCVYRPTFFDARDSFRHPIAPEDCPHLHRIVAAGRFAYDWLTMTPDRWRQIEELYHSARERGVGVLVDTDPDLRREVERLLAQDSEGKILDQPAAGLLDAHSNGECAAGYGRPDRVPLQDPGKDRRRRNGSRLQGRGHPPAAVRGAQISAG